MSIFVSSRAVDRNLQEAFAAFSGDRNPMHMDAVAARRTQAGLPVVHGVHSLLWALESLAAAGRLDGTLRRVKVRFRNWIYLDDTATLETPDETKNPRTFEIAVSGMPALSADLLYDGPAPAPGSFEPSPAEPVAEAVERSFEDLDETPRLAFVAPVNAASALFPHLVALFGASVAEIAACSYVVGMLAPGLHSMFSKLDLALAPRLDGAQTALEYRVPSHDERFRKVRLVVRGSGIEGALEAFLRVAPVQQATLAGLRGLVAADEFRGMRALVVGGSRGLGELTAKLIAAGGGVPTITYALGQAEAQKLVAEIAAAGGEADALRYDVREAPAGQLPPDAGYTHLFYFATNLIGRPKAALVSAPILAEFVTFYLYGFHDLCVELTRSGATLAAYYPSTIYLEARPAGMTEYAMIKAAGEEMVRDMNEHIAGLRVIATRLPRLPTDQTAGVLPERGLEPAAVMLPIVRQMWAER